MNLYTQLAQDVANMTDIVSEIEARMNQLEAVYMDAKSFTGSIQVHYHPLPVLMGAPFCLQWFLRDACANFLQTWYNGKVPMEGLMNVKQLLSLCQNMAIMDFFHLILRYLFILMHRCWDRFFSNLVKWIHSMKTWYL